MASFGMGDESAEPVYRAHSMSSYLENTGNSGSRRRSRRSSYVAEEVCARELATFYQKEGASTYLKKSSSLRLNVLGSSELGVASARNAGRVSLEISATLERGQNVLKSFLKEAHRLGEIPDTDAELEAHFSHFLSTFLNTDDGLTGVTRDRLHDIDRIFNLMKELKVRQEALINVLFDFENLKIDPYNGLHYPITRDIREQVLEMLPIPQEAGVIFGDRTVGKGLQVFYENELHLRESLGEPAKNLLKDNRLPSFFRQFFVLYLDSLARFYPPSVKYFQAMAWLDGVFCNGNHIIKKMKRDVEITNRRNQSLDMTPPSSAPTIESRVAQ